MAELQKNILDSDHVGRLLLKFAIPAFLAMAVHTLYNVVDTIFIGRYVGPLAIAGLSLVFPIQMLSLGIGQMAGMGGSSLISRLLGSKEIQKAERTLGNAIMITAVLSLVVTIAGLANVEYWCRFLGATDTILPYAEDYLTIILYAMIFMTFGMMLSTVIRAGGNAKVPMIGMIASAVMNIVLDALFIIPLGMGVKGAAWATLISHVFQAVYFMSYYFIGKPELRFKLVNLKPDWKIIGEIVAIGVSALGMTLAGSASAILVNRTIVVLGGDIAMSAYGIINRTMMFAIMPAIVVGQALQPIIGFNYGAKRFDRVIRGIIIGVVSTTVIGLGVFAIVFSAPEAVVKIFTNDAELIRIGSYACQRVFSVMFLIGLINVGSTVFQSLGKAVQAIFSTVSRSVLFLIPAILILPKFIGIDGVWWAFPISDFLTFVLVTGMLIPVVTDLRRKRIMQDPELATGLIG